MAWWLLLSGGVSLLRAWINSSTLVWVNRVAGVILVAFGGCLLIGLMG